MQVLVHGPGSEIRDRLCRSLASREHDVHVTENASEARGAFREARPGMVVLLPDGAEVLEMGRRMREAREDVLLVFVCAGGTPASPTAAFEAGADDCILATQVDRLDTRLAFVEQYVRHQKATILNGSRPSGVRGQALVAEIGRRALAGTDLEVLTAYAARATARALGVDCCGVWKHHADPGILELVAGAGWEAGAVGQACVGDDPSMEPGCALDAPGPVVIEDAAEDERFGRAPLMEAHGLSSSAHVTIASTPEPYGVLSVHAGEPRAFGDEEVYVLQSVANVLAGGVERDRTERALRESEARARSILETTVDGVITIDERGRIESFNAAAEDIFGYDAEEVKGENVKVLMPSPYREEHDGYMRSYRETGRRHIIGIGREVTGRRKDGSTFPMDLAVSEMEVGGRRIFTGIVRDISERRRLEKEILNISDQERRRIGQDLHDGLGQMLTGIGLLSQNLTRRLDDEDHPLAGDMNEITELVKEADQYARDLARGLTPVDVDASGLSDALQRLSNNAVRLFDVEATFEEVGTALVHNATAAMHLYRIAQESVSNAVRHGGADRIRLRLASGPNQIRLRVQDDGSGFDASAHDGPGMGVNIMNYRARIIGGTLDIQSSPGEGTIVTCTLPRTAYPAEAESDETGPASAPSSAAGPHRT
jgi:PAS domain S-box-containing protein